MIKWIYKLLLSAAILLSVQFLYSQEFSCIDNLNQARKFYNNGNLDTTIALLEECLDNRRAFRQLSRSTKAEIYRLAALTNYLDYQPDKAWENVKKLISKEPVYYQNFREDDIAEFRAAVNSMEPIPFFKISLVNQSYYTAVVPVNEIYHVLETQGLQSKEYTGGWNNAQLGLVFEFALKKNLLVSFGSGINEFYYNFRSEYGSSQDPFVYEYEQRMYYLGTPITAKYKFISTAKKSLQPYALCRLEWDYLLDAKRRENKNEKFTVPVNYLMKSNYFSYSIGGGFFWKLGCEVCNYFFSFDLRYTGCFSTINNADTRYDYDQANELIFSDFNIMDDITLRNFSVGLGIHVPIVYKAFDK